MKKELNELKQQELNELTLFINELSSKVFELISMAQRLGLDFRVDKINNSLYFSLDIPTDSWYSHNTLQLCLDMTDDINIILDRRNTYYEMLDFCNELKEEREKEEKKKEIISRIKSKLSSEELKILGHTLFRIQ